MATISEAPDAVDRLRATVAAVGAGETAVGNAVLLRRARRALADATAERDALAKRLDDGWRWLDAHPRDPRHGRHEDRWIGWLGDYQRLHDAVAHAEGRLA